MSVAPARSQALPPSRAEAFVISAVEGARKIRALREVWTDLLLTSQAPNVFLSWEWMTSWIETQDSAGEPYVLLVRRPEDQTVVGLAPLVRTAGRGPLGLRTVRFMGGGVGADHLGFVSPAGMEDRVCAALSHHLLADETWDVLEFLRMDEAQAAWLVDALLVQDRCAYSLAVEDVCPFLRLPKAWDDYLRLIGSDRRKQVARRWRRLREQDEVIVQRVSDGAELEAAWQALIELHRTRRHAMGRSSVFVTARSKTFHERFVRMALERGWLRLYLLRVGGQPVAAEYGLCVGGRVASFQGGFDVRWSRYGVGGLLVTHAIEEAIGAGATEFDFLRGTEAYKRELGATEHRKDVSLVIWRRRPRVAMVMAARRWARRLKERYRWNRQPS